MKTRILVAVVCIPLLLAVIFFLPLWAFGILAAAICACAAWEFLRCTVRNVPMRFFFYVSISAALIPLGTSFNLGALAAILPLFLLTTILFVEMILSFRRAEQIPYTTVILGITAGVVIPTLLSALVRLGLYPSKGVLILLPFVVTFTCDSGAYFTGVAIGKHKIAPHVSPHKTVEGSVGGLVAAVLCTVLYGIILKSCGFQVHIAYMLVYGLLGGIVCEIGDLAFSAVKRQCGIKDYGNLIPGHGGALDRFDSATFVAPLIEILMLLIPAITK